VSQLGVQRARAELTMLRTHVRVCGPREVIRGKKVLFNMDSRAGVQNMLNQGGSKRDLNGEFRAWLLVIEELQIEPYFTWAPREENARPMLCRSACLAWKLSDGARADMATSFPSEEWTLPDLNQIGNVLLEARNTGKDLVLVHPWWNLVHHEGLEGPASLAHAGHAVAFLKLQQEVLLIPRAQNPVVVTGFLLVLAIAGRRRSCRK
jgi:hypothetical protein